MNKVKDWKEVQTFYDLGNTYLDICSKFNTSTSAIYRASIRGDFILSRNRSERRKLAPPRKHSEETKKKISNIRIKYLEDNPDKVPYMINHSSKKSYPEVLFENALLSSGLTGWEYNYRNGIYCYDFAWVKEKIDVEIDGGTHETEKVKKIDYRRDNWSKSLGWRIVRFTAKEIKTDILSCLDRLRIELDK